MKVFLMVLFVSLFIKLNSQTILNTDTIGSTSTKEVYVFPIASDSLSSSFCIVINTEVKPHKHLHHSEQVIVLDGVGEMKINNKTYFIKKGNVVFIPKGTTHSVIRKEKKPLKVISVQAPFFNGKDRVLITE